VAREDNERWHEQGQQQQRLEDEGGKRNRAPDGDE